MWINRKGKYPYFLTDQRVFFNIFDERNPWKPQYL